MVPCDCGVFYCWGFWLLFHFCKGSMFMAEIMKPEKRDWGLKPQENYHLSTHLWNHSSAFKQKHHNFCLFSICSCHVQVLLVRVLAALQQVSANPLLIKYLCKYSASLHIEQQREPLPPFWQRSLSPPSVFFQAPKKCLILKIPEYQCCQQWFFFFFFCLWCE